MTHRCRLLARGCNPVDRQTEFGIAATLPPFKLIHFDPVLLSLGSCYSACSLSVVVGKSKIMRQMRARCLPSISASFVKWTVGDTRVLGAESAERPEENLGRARLLPSHFVWPCLFRRKSAVGFTVSYRHSAPEIFRGSPSQLQQAS